MTAVEWHEYLVRLAVEAGADAERASERMAQCAQTFALLTSDVEAPMLAPGGAADVLANARELRIAEMELRALTGLPHRLRERKQADRRVSRARRALDAVLGAREPWSSLVDRGLSRWCDESGDSAAYARHEGPVPGASVFRGGAQ